MQVQLVSNASLLFSFCVSRFSSVQSHPQSVRIHTWTCPLSKHQVHSRMTSVLHCLAVKFLCLNWKKHAAVEGIWEKHPFIVILDHRLARPEDFLNESRVTFQQTKTSTQPDNPVNSMPCMCVCAARLSHISGCGHKHSLYPSVCRLVFYCTIEKTTRTHCLGQSASLLSSTTQKLLALTNGGTHNRPFITAIKQQESAGFRKPNIRLCVIFLNGS